MIRPRRWFNTPELLQWKMMAETGNYTGPFFSFPLEPNKIWEQNGVYLIEDQHGKCVGFYASGFTTDARGVAQPFAGPIKLNTGRPPEPEPLSKEVPTFEKLFGGPIASL